MMTRTILMAAAIASLSLVTPAHARGVTVQKTHSGKAVHGVRVARVGVVNRGFGPLYPAHPIAGPGFGCSYDRPTSVDAPYN